MTQPCCSPSSDDRSATDAALLATQRYEAKKPAGKAESPEPLIGTESQVFVTVPEGSFAMGSEDSAYPADGEGPVRQVSLSAFKISATAVTNTCFAEFVSATGWITEAEQQGSSFVFGGLLPDDFPPTQGVAAAPWWRLVEGADWRHPEGPQSTVAQRMDHPVVQVTWEDAVAYCEWADARLPTEAEWERAARGGLTGKRYPWGDQREPEGEHRMNVFQGEFPGNNTAEDGFPGTAPADAYKPNGLGLFNTCGNVWEWCGDFFDPSFHVTGPRQDPCGPPAGTHRVMRGGSYLCHESYCWRYRVSARSANTAQSSAGNIGFRVARSDRG
jgi:formylglycine-generating enzyme required for sulfatase activity